MIAISYCTFTLALVAYTLYTENRAFDAQIIKCETDLESKSLEEIEKRRSTSRAINNVVLRILCYIAIPLITQVGYAVAVIWSYYQNDSYILNLWSATGVSFPGVFNFIAFMMDPAIHNAYKSIKR